MGRPTSGSLTFVTASERARDPCCEQLGIGGTLRDGLRNRGGCGAVIQAAPFHILEIAPSDLGVTESASDLRLQSLADTPPRVVGSTRAALEVVTERSAQAAHGSAAGVTGGAEAVGEPLQDTLLDALKLPAALVTAGNHYTFVV